MPARLGKIAALVAVNAVLLVVGVLLLELVFGQWISKNDLNKLNIVRSRTVKFDISKVYPSDQDIGIYSRDAYGLRGSYGRPEDIQVLTVGGSTTDQRYISDGSTWQDVLQQRFRESGRNVVIANAGIDGQSTYGHIKNFDWYFNRIPGLKPKYVLFYVGVNDFYKDEGFGLDALVPEKKRLREILRESSALYHVAYTLYGIISAEVVHEAGHGHVDFRSISWTVQPLHAGYDAIMQKRLQEYGERLEVLVVRTRSLGGTPIFVTQPTRRYRHRDGILEGTTETTKYDNLRVNGVDYYHMMRRMDAVTCGTSRTHGIMCIDLAKEDVWADEDFYDYTHMTPRGARKVGELLFAQLKTRL